MCVFACRDRDAVLQHLLFALVLMLCLSDVDVTDIYKQRAVEPEYCFDDLITVVRFEFDINYISPVCF